LGYHPVAVVILHVHKYKNKVTRKFKLGGLHERHVVSNLETWKPSQHSLVDTGKTRRTCVEEKPVSRCEGITPCTLTIWSLTATIWVVPHS